MDVDAVVVVDVAVHVVVVDDVDNVDNVVAVVIVVIMVGPRNLTLKFGRIRSVTDEILLLLLVLLLIPETLPLRFC